MSESAEYQPESRSLLHVPPALAHLLAVAQAMRAMLAECQTPPGTPPEVEAVHQLRTGTRRVEAMLETLARAAGARGLGVSTEAARQRWLRQLKKVRQAAGSVRDLDVHRELLAKHFLPEHVPAVDDTARELAGATTAAHDSSLVAMQARSLDAWLAAHRSHAAQALAAALTGRTQKLEQVEQQFVLAFNKRRAATRRTARSAARLALEDYLRLMDALPHLDAHNLHDFRKGAKKARYVAEAGGDDPVALAMARAIKRVQDAIGDWHDWEVLTEESHQALGADGVALEAVLEHRVQREYERALRTTATTGRRLVGEWQATRSRVGTRNPASRLRVTLRQKL